MLSNEIYSHIQAKVPLLWIQTHEEGRFLRMLRKMPNSRIYAWNATSGLADSGKKSLSAPVNMLEHIGSNESPEGVYVLLDFQHYIENPQVIRLLLDFCETSRKEGNKTIVFISPEMNLPAELERELVVFTPELPNAKVIYSYLTRTVSHMVKSGIITSGFSRREHLVQTIQNLKGLTLNQIDDVLAYTVIKKNVIDPQEILRQKIQRLSHDSILEIEDWRKCPSFEEIGGLSRLKKWLDGRKTVFLDASAREAHELPIPRGVLLTGVQGGGKSYIAKACAREWKVPLVTLELGRIFSSRVGESEASLRRALRVVESMQPALLFIDEFEKGFSGVQSSGLSDGGTASRVFGTFLTWLQEHRSQVFIVATTNEITTVPPEVMRRGRFDEIFFIDLPGLRERERIFSIYLKKYKLYHLHPEAARLAGRTEGYTAAEIQQIVVNAVYAAVAEGTRVDMRVMEEAVRQLIPLSVTRSEELERTRSWAKGRCTPAAYEEAGIESKSARAGSVGEGDTRETGADSERDGGNGADDGRIVQFPAQ